MGEGGCGNFGVCNWNAINVSFGDVPEIVAVVSDSVNRMFGWGTATTILPEEALLCCLCLRIVEILVRLRAG